MFECVRACTCECVTVCYVRMCEYVCVCVYIYLDPERRSLFFLWIKLGISKAHVHGHHSPLPYWTCCAHDSGEPTVSHFPRKTLLLLLCCQLCPAHSSFPHLFGHSHGFFLFECGYCSHGGQVPGLTRHENFLVQLLELWAG